MKEFKNKCKICDSSFKSISKEAKYCSLPCFVIYLESEEFDDELCEALGIKKEKNGKKAIIFDLYDTLVRIGKKSKPYLYLLSHCTMDSKEVIETVMTMDMVSTGYCSQLIDNGKMKHSFDVSHFTKLLDDELESTVAFHDTYRVLNRLSQKYRLFLLSNLATPYKYPYYKLDLERYIEKAFFSCECNDKKPNASFFQQVIDYSGLQKEQLLMIGDDPISDYKGAMDAGIDAILKNDDLTIITSEL